MTPQEKVANAAHQINQIMDGNLLEYWCPFCGLGTDFYEERVTGAMCCELTGNLVLEIAKTRDVKKGAELAEKVMDRFNRSNFGVPTIQ